MAESKVSYPIITAANWWTLRRQFKRSVPQQVTPSYLQTVLGIGDKTARDNEIPTLKKLGLIDEKLNTTDSAHRWRDDAEYPKACKEMVDALYPRELVDAVTDIEDDAAAARWFMRVGRVGEGTAARMAKTFRMLREADLGKEPERTVRPRPTPAAGTTRAPREPRRDTQQVQGQAPQVDQSASRPHTGRHPTVHIDVQVHISADASPNQIDQVFASMAKHLYGRESQ